MPESYDAGKEAAELAKQNLNSSANLAIVFTSSIYKYENILTGVAEVFKDVKLIGASTAGEITGDGSFSNSVTVLALSSDNIEFFTGIGENMDKNAFKAGEQLGEDLIRQEKDLSAVIAIPDGLAGNGADVIRGMQKIIGEKTLIIGGSAGDDFKSQETYEFLNGKVFSKSIVGCGLKGDFNIGIGVRHGWTTVGVSRKVTKAQGNVLFELDNKPALDLYAAYMGEETAEKLKSNPMIAINEGATHPLGIDMGEDKYLIRQPFFASQDGSLTCAAEIPEGSQVFLMLGDADSVIESAKQAASDAIKQLNGQKPSVILIFSCGARSIVLDRTASEQIKVIKEIVGQDVPLAGFVCYGELAPLAASSDDAGYMSYFHNDTVVVLALA